MQVAAVVGGLPSLRGDEAGHPAAVRVAQGLALLGAVGKQVGTCEGQDAKGGFRDCPATGGRGRGQG